MTVCFVMVFAKYRDECSPMVWCHSTIENDTFWASRDCTSMFMLWRPPPPSLFVTFTSDWNVTLRLGPATTQPATNTENKKWSHSAKQDSCIEDSRQLRLGRRSSLQYRFLIKLSSHSVSVNIHEIVAATKLTEMLLGSTDHHQDQVPKTKTPHQQFIL